MSSRSIDDLNQYTKDACKKHISACEARGVELLVYCTKRSNQEQDAAYAIGRTAPGKIVTNARAGESSHNPDENDKSAAYDCVPLLSGKAMWDTKHPSWRIVIEEGENAGLIASARWTGKLRETCHFQDPHWHKRS